MRILLPALILITSAAHAWSEDLYVPARIDNEGTLHDGYHKTKPDSSKLNNYSTEGNANPYTGKTGTVDPYKIKEPTYRAPSYDSDKTWVNSYDRKDGTHVEGHSRRK